VPITPFIKGKVFDSEAVAAMSAVFVEVCGRLRLADRADPITRFVADRIIELASTGDYDEAGLRAAALKVFDVSD
jgi:hypothetical protein